MVIKKRVSILAIFIALTSGLLYPLVALSQTTPNTSPAIRGLFVAHGAKKYDYGTILIKGAADYGANCKISTIIKDGPNATFPMDSICSFPNLWTGLDKDKDGIPSIYTGQKYFVPRTPLVLTDQVSLPLDDKFTLNKEGIEYVSATASYPVTGKDHQAARLGRLNLEGEGYPDWISVSGCTIQPIGTRIDPIGFTTAATTLCTLNDYGFVEYTDCNDYEPLIGVSGSYSNTAPIKIIDIARVNKQESSFSYDSYLATRKFMSRGFNPLDTLVIAIQTSPCIENIQVDATLEFDNGTVFSLGKIGFTKPSTTEKKYYGFDLLEEEILIGFLHHSWPLQSITASSETSEMQFLKAVSSRNGPPTLKLKPPGGAATGIAKYPLLINLCVPIAGTGARKIVLRRPFPSDPATTPGWFYQSVKAAQEVWSDTIQSIPPFAQLQDKFSIFADLSPFVEVAGPSIQGNTYLDTNLSKLEDHSHCDYESIPIYESNIATTSYAQNASIFVGKNYVNGRMKSLSSYWGTTYSEMIGHELGHIVGGLNDEYISVPLPANESEWEQFKSNAVLTGRVGTNCVLPENVPSTFPPPYNVITKEDPRAGCWSEPFFRSSVVSLMRDHAISNRFNILSCAFIVRNILGVGKVSDYFTQCASYETAR